MFTPKIQTVIDAVDGLREKVDDHWQIPADEAKLLTQLVKLGRCKSICEIGTSYGFSTLHFAAAVSWHGGHVHTLDIEPRKTDAARKSLTEAGLIGVVTLLTGRAQDVLKSLKPRELFDFVFIDAWKEESLEYLRAVTPLLAKQAVLVTDNTDTHKAELAGFVEHLRGLKGATSCNVSVGNGFEFTIVSR